MDRDRARAVLGVSRNASTREIKRAFRRLVKMWHPDRFGDDPVGQKEANAQLRVLAEAYHSLAGREARVAEPAAVSSPPEAARHDPPNAPLSPEEIGRMVEAVGPEGHWDALLAGLGVVTLLMGLVLLRGAGSTGDIFVALLVIIMSVVLVKKRS